MTDDQIRKLPRGGHDYRKVYAAFEAATEHVGQPTVILAQTIKGWTIDALEGSNATHQMKKLTTGRPQEVPRPAATCRSPTGARAPTRTTGAAPFYHPGEDSDEIQYMQERRRAARRLRCPSAWCGRRPLKLPGDEVYAELKQGSGKQRDRHHDGRSSGCSRT